MKIMLVDDDKIVLESLKTIIEAGGHIVTDAISEPVKAVSTFHRSKPDVVVMDIKMPEQDGITTAKAIYRAYPDAKILLLTTLNEEELITEAISLGVCGYILKENPAQILPAITAVGAGNMVFGTEIVDKIKLKKNQNFAPKELTDIEISITTLVAVGFNNKEIARELFLTEGTIRNYISTILKKLGLRDRTQLAVYYYKYIS